MLINKDLIELKKITSNVSWQDFDAYEKLKSRLKEEKRILKILEKQASEKLSEEITNAIPFMKDGSLIPPSNVSMSVNRNGGIVVRSQDIQGVN